MSESLIAFQPAIDEPSNMKPSSNRILADGGDRKRRVLFLPAWIREAQIDPFDVVIFYELQGIFRL